MPAIKAQQIKQKAFYYTIKTMHKLAYIQAQRIIESNDTPSEICEWWNGLAYRTQRNYHYEMIRMLEQGYFIRERGCVFYKYGLEDIFDETQS